jgi:hypothetical protein
MYSGMPLIERAKIPQSSLIVTLYCKPCARAMQLQRVWYVLPLVTQEYVDGGRIVRGIHV